MIYVENRLTSENKEAIPIRVPDFQEKHPEISVFIEKKWHIA